MDELEKPRRFYSSGQVFCSAFLGGPFAGCWFLSRNYKFIGDDDGVRASLVWGIIVCLIMGGLVVFLPANFPDKVIPLAYSFGLKAFADNLKRRTPALMTAPDSQKGSHWRVFGISVLCLALMFALMIVVIMALDNLHLLPESFNEKTPVK